MYKEYNIVMLKEQAGDFQLSGISSKTKAELTAAGLDPPEVETIVRRALEEDLRLGPDITTITTTDPKTVAAADVVARRPGMLAGVPVVLAVLDIVGMPQKSTAGLLTDGTQLQDGALIMRITGPLQQLLTAERTLLNFMTHLSGIATLTHTWVETIEGTNCKVRDTRKTLPGLRSLEKYAVRCGGGVNHRMALGDAALIKDNHVIAAGSIAAAIDAVRNAAPMLPLEVECDTLSQVKEALAKNVKLILLDNMSLADIRRSVKLGSIYPHTKFEASGGLKLETAKAVAATGVDFVAVGALTHSSPALDIAVDVRPIN